MKPFLTLLAITILPSSADGAVAKGENLLVNGRLEAEQVDFPEFWSSSSAKNVFYRRTGGPKGKTAALVLKSDGTMHGTLSARQQGMNLVPGETYKLSGYIKTKGFKSRYAGLIVHNSGWKSAAGLTTFPADSEWTFHEKTFKLMPSKNNEYGVAMFAVGLTGEIHFADLKLEALSEKARQGCTSQMALIAVPRLVPLRPLLHKIPRAKAELIFRCYGIPSETRPSYECLVTIDGNPAAKQTVPLGKDGKIVVRLAGLPLGDSSLKAVVRDHKTRETIVEGTFPISIVDVPPIDRRNIKQLNNLVAEILNEPVEKRPGPRTFSFVNPRDGWVFVAFNTDGPVSEDLTIKIDGRNTVIIASTDRLEAFRERNRSRVPEPF